ncbi:ATP-binding protein [Streptantibioticus ferralitis]|uniref:ATP-binding protein n=1 Tax=Streptantibioticus ferralitis TaxID=236510 RepID=A0ABT5ZAY0_9ACTN|nr:ATP-binding protein [Streptantibioticus ferralitis]MDF2260878.1 ATP-binding protein [Streptantibioticus ferralitis]
MAKKDGPWPSYLGQHLRAERLRTFAGRTAELDAFRSALQAADSFTVFFLTGPGGVGKSTLLRRFADEAAAAGRVVVEVDGHGGEAVPAVFEADAAEALTGDRVVLLVDTFEAYQPIEDWLRDRFLPRLPTGSVVVLAGRQPPGVGWVDPGWDEVLRTVVLADLSPEDAVAMLTARGVPAALHGAVVAFAKGHPLALSLAAEMVRREGGRNTGWRPSHEVIGTLVHQLVGEVPSPEHRQALEVCAHVDSTTEGLLRAALPGADTGALFAWLRRLPFIKVGPSGVRPHDLVRELLDADLRWRDPQRYATMHRRLFRQLIEQARTASGSTVLASSAALLHLQRHAGLAPHWFSGKFDGEVFEDVLRPEDRQEVLALAAEHANEESVALADYWLDRQPGAFTVYRCTESGELAGFLAWLRFTVPQEEELTADPVVAAAWAHVRATNPLRGKEHLGIARFMVSRRPNPSPTGDLISARILAHLIHADLLAWSCLVLPNPDEWRLSLFTHMDPPPVAQVGAQTYGLFGRDWRAEPVEAWLDRMDLLGSRQDGPSRAVPAHDARTRKLEVLSRPEFDTAVRNALRSWHRPDALAANPLIRTRLVGEITADDPVEALRTALSEAIERLGGDRGGEKPQRAVTVTFLHGTATQEAAAERLNLPFSTYRRHLTRGLERVCDLLWYSELHGPLHTPD